MCPLVGQGLDVLETLSPVQMLQQRPSGPSGLSAVVEGDNIGDGAIQVTVLGEDIHLPFITGVTKITELVGQPGVQVCMRAVELSSIDPRLDLHPPEIQVKFW